MLYFTVDMKTIAQSGLTGSDLLVYCALRYLSKTGAWKGSSYKLAGLSGCGDRKTAQRSVSRLIEFGLITQTKEGLILGQNDPSAGQNDPKAGQNDPKSKESSKEKEINKNLPTKIKVDGGGLVDFSLDFLEFWSAYNPLPEYDNRKLGCYRIWNKLPSDWKTLALKVAGNHAEDTNPFFWLKEEAFLRVGSRKPDKEAVVRKPHWLTPEEVESAWRSGIELVVCKNKETDRFGTVTKQDAEEFNLVIHHKM